MVDDSSAAPPPSESLNAIEAAQIVADSNLGTLEGQRTLLDALDTKASFIVTLAGVALGALLTALATRSSVPAWALAFSFTGAVMLTLCLASGLFVWWPRRVQMVDPRGLHQHHFAGSHRGVLNALSDRAVLAYESNRGLEGLKVAGIRLAIGSLVLGVVFSAAGILLAVHP